MAISTVHPSSNSLVSNLQTVFQSTFGGPSSVIWLSPRPPMAFAVNR
jgi:hypothetical protein